MEGRLGTEIVHRQGAVYYRRLHTRSLVGRCSSERMPFQRTVNPYRGCAIGCRYCYATYTHEFIGLGAEEFHKAVFVKDEGDVREGLRSAIARGEHVALGTATDPYQPGEGRLRATRAFLEAACEFRDLTLSITTKSALVLRDLALLRRVHERSCLSVGVSLISPQRRLLAALEPWAPPPAARLEVMRRLLEAGIKTTLIVAPVLPGLTDGKKDLDELLRLAHQAGVRRASHAVLFLRSPARETFLKFVRETFPRWRGAYERAYARSAYLGPGYQTRIAELFATLCTRHGLQPGEPERRTRQARAPVQQLTLWPVSGA